MNEKAPARLQMLNSLSEHKVPMAQAVEILGVTEHRAWRMLAAYRKERAAALVLGGLGCQPPNASPDELAAVVVNLGGTLYSGTNHVRLTELLRGREGIELGHRTARRILTKVGLPNPRGRRTPEYRTRLLRMHQTEMQIKVDVSHHSWLKDRGPGFVLVSSWATTSLIPAL